MAAPMLERFAQFACFTRAAPVLALALACAAVPVAAARAQDGAFSLTIKNHRFQPSELRVPAGKAVSITVRNLDATPEEFESNALKIEKVIPGNSEGMVRLRPLKPGRYEFVGEYNERTAKGVIVVE